MLRDFASGNWLLARWLLILDAVVARHGRLGASGAC
jgi:hypothetical protein